jgi:hypothetical protein
MHHRISTTLRSLRQDLAARLGHDVRWTPETGQLGGLDLLWLSATVPPAVDPGPIYLTRGHLSE